MNRTLLRRAGAVTLVAATLSTLTGCATGIGATLTFHDTQTAKVDRIVLDGGSGDVQVKAVPGTETRITRTIRSGSDPEPSFSVSGAELHLSGSCGSDCSVSYAIETPPGVAVTGSLTSGSMMLTGIGTADVRADSGDIDIRQATGTVRAETDSGDLLVADTKGAATLQAGSGDITAQRMAGAVTATASSGTIDVRLSAPASVKAISSSGDITVTVPPGAYRTTTEADSGDIHVDGITQDAKSANLLDVRASSGDVTVAAAPAA
jgi:hypothetical protein